MTLDDLMILRNALAHRMEYVQAGGGNISVKHGDKMYIKASGFAFSDITRQKGWSLLEYRKVIEHYETLGDFIGHLPAENAATKAILETQIAGARPSLETAFHAFLPGAVIHTHPALTNILVCSEDGEGYAKNFLPEAIWIKQKPPGHQLAKEIFDKLHLPLAERIILLENHGIIVHARTASRALELHDAVNEYLRELYGVDDRFSPLPLKRQGKHYVDTSEYMQKYIESIEEEDLRLPMFPDQKIYCGKDYQIADRQSDLTEPIGIIKGDGVFYDASKFDKKKANKIHEVFSFFAYVLHHIKFRGSKPKFMSLAHSQYLDSMESEKYRKTIK